MNNHDSQLIHELEVVFGEEKAKEAARQINRLKSQDPNAKFEIIFNEDGTMNVRKKP